MLKKFYILLILLFGLNAHGQLIKLDYTPNGRLIEFTLDSVRFYSDLESVLSVVENYEDSTFRKELTNEFLAKSETSADTIRFTGHFVPFSDSLNNKEKGTWYMDYLMLKLTLNNRVLIYDKSNNKVTTIKKRLVKKKEHFNGDYIIRTVYINLDNKEKLFSMFKKSRISLPSGFDNKKTK